MFTCYCDCCYSELKYTPHHLHVLIPSDVRDYENQSPLHIICSFADEQLGHSTVFG